MVSHVYNMVRHLYDMTSHVFSIVSHVYKIARHYPKRIMFECKYLFEIVLVTENELLVHMDMAKP